MKRDFIVGSDPESNWGLPGRKLDLARTEEEATTARGLEKQRGGAPYCAALFGAGKNSDTAGPSWTVEDGLFERGADLVVGVDEAGRGALAGPLVVGACALRPGGIPEGIDDSKRLSAQRRKELELLIKKWAVAWGIGIAEVSEIDGLGISEALCRAADRAVQAALENLGQKARLEIHVLVDGPVSFVKDYPATPIKKGDSISLSIAAASILAKVHRDRLMIDLADEYPDYGFGSHKGYGTASHIKALRSYGPSPVHRRSFAPVRDVISRFAGEQLSLRSARVE